MRRIVRRAAIAWLVPLVLCGCRGPGGRPRGAVAKVGSTYISEVELETEVERFSARMRAPGGALALDQQERIRASTLMRMIDETLFRDRAAALGVTVSADEIEQKLAD